jgi:chromosome transmission fidelity protein 4
VEFTTTRQIPPKTRGTIGESQPDYFSAPVSFGVAPQLPFQPCATEKDKPKRFLAFNDVGLIVSRDEHTQFAIEIEFHDTSKHRPVKLSDRNNLSLGTLSKSSMRMGLTLQMREEQHLQAT